MKTPVILLAFSLILFQYSCQKSIVKYETAIKSCVPVEKIIKQGSGTMAYRIVPTDCILGAQLPAFEEKSMDGKMINRDYFAGKVSFINFWHIGCRPCEEEMPLLNQLVEKYKDQPVNFLAIGMNTVQDVPAFLLKHPFNFDHIPYGYSLTMDIFQLQWGNPLTLIVDRHLKIISIVQDKLDNTKMEKEIIPIIDHALKKF
ncbi:MAG: TlpA family protein disulfide reductase [Saprospiraceae bacterium]|uniref:TlpA family protein disulfide reductase n=1 Tax=Candidatus Opimibacter skivensis TaxID=2982028 RepID=A0A9D7XS17_9BACT|nr:TlpA family protein disulfide reductase [Candidatus Opimibacter skivensis]